MPIRARTLRPRGSRTTQAKRRDDDAVRRARHPWRALYGTARWAAIRRAQLLASPLCRMCLDEGRIEPATVCDHVDPHRGDVVKFFAGPFQSLCAHHHNREKQRSERGGGG